MSSNTAAFNNSAEGNTTTEIHFMNDTQVINQLNGFDDDWSESITNDENQ